MYDAGASPCGYSQYSSGSFPSIARMFARLQSTQRNWVRPASKLTVQPSGTPPGAHGRLVPQREQIREEGCSERVLEAVAVRDRVARLAGMASILAGWLSAPGGGGGLPRISQAVTLGAATVGT